MFRIHTSLCGMKGTMSVEIFGWVCWLHIAQNTAAKSRFSIDERLTEGLGCSALSRFFVNHSSFCLLCFVPQFLWKHALFVFKDFYRVGCTRFPFSSSISVISSHSRSSSHRFLNSVMLLAIVFNVLSVFTESLRMFIKYLLGAYSDAGHYRILPYL